MVIHLDVGREKSVLAIEEAMIHEPDNLFGYRGKPRRMTLVLMIFIR